MSTSYQVTPEDIRRRRTRLVEIEREAAEIQRWLDSVRVIFGDEPFDKSGAAATQHSEHAPPVKQSSRRALGEINMTTAVLTALAAAPRGLTSSELRREISANPIIEERLDKSLAYFYKLVGRLKKKGLVKNDGKRLVAVHWDERGPSSGGRR